MDRNRYQRHWRKENRLLQQYLNQESESDDNVVDGQHSSFEDTTHDCWDITNAVTNEESGNSSSDDESDWNEILLNEDLNVDLNTQVENITEDLARWILRNKINRTASNELLSMLRKYGFEEVLPKCTRTLLGTPRNSVVESKCGGDYAYLGLEKGIFRVFTENKDLVLPENKILLIVNVDGLPIFKSTGTQFWPILCAFNDIRPFTVALFQGTSKPSDLHEFLKDFLEEYTKLKDTGFNFKEKAFTVNIFAFTCDAPARQYLKCVKGHNGYFGCERCECEGVHQSGRMLFHSLDCPLRNGEAFKQFKYTGTHQLELTPLVNYGVDCIRQFPLEYMHLVCLGVVKRLLLVWKEGARPFKLSSTQIATISNELSHFSGKFPSEFARQPRQLTELKRWKATEFRQFLLFSGPVVLKSVLHKENYDHFLCLALAIRILLDTDNNIRNSNINYARELIQFFVGKSRDLYGDTFTVYNVHSLIHICDDVAYFNCSLDSISSFPFENHLQMFKKFIRKAQNAISQIVRRVAEFDNHSVNICPQKSSTCSLSVKEKDSWVLLKNGDYAQIKGCTTNKIFLCHIFMVHLSQSFFTTPCDSKKFHIVIFGNGLNYRQKQLHASSFLRKAVCLPHKNGKVLIPLLHKI